MRRCKGNPERRTQRKTFYQAKFRLRRTSEASLSACCRSRATLYLRNKQTQFLRPPTFLLTILEVLPCFKVSSHSTRTVIAPPPSKRSLPEPLTSGGSLCHCATRPNPTPAFRASFAARLPSLAPRCPR